MREYYLYFVTNWNNRVLYTGITNNLERRVYEHKHKTIKGFSATYNTNKLVYFEIYNDVNEAIAREKQIKNWNRKKKDMLVVKINPNWKDLSEDWFKDPSASLGMTSS